MSQRLRSVREMFFDGSCPVCGRSGVVHRRADRGVCTACADGLDPAPALTVPPGLDACRALTAYTGTGRELVVRLKFQDHRAVVPFAADRLAALLAGDRPDVVTWAPTSPSRRRQRGFDQAEVLARALARRLGVPVRRCLVRLPGPAQTGRHRDERITGPAFDARRGIAGAVNGRRVVLVDDVATTGATLARAAAVLRATGAATVTGAVVARTPAARPTPRPVFGGPRRGRDATRGVLS